VKGVRRTALQNFNSGAGSHWVIVSGSIKREPGTSSITRCNRLWKFPAICLLLLHRGKTKGADTLGPDEREKRVPTKVPNGVPLVFEKSGRGAWASPNGGRRKRSFP